MNSLLEASKLLPEWKQRDQEYYQFSAREGVDLCMVLG